MRLQISAGNVIADGFTSYIPSFDLLTHHCPRIMMRNHLLVVVPSFIELVPELAYTIFVMSWSLSPLW